MQQPKLRLQATTDAIDQIETAEITTTVGTTAIIVDAVVVEGEGSEVAIVAGEVEDEAADQEEAEIETEAMIADRTTAMQRSANARKKTTSHAAVALEYQRRTQRRLKRRKPRRRSSSWRS